MSQLVGIGPGTRPHWTLDGVILTNQAPAVVGGGASKLVQLFLLDGVQPTPVRTGRLLLLLLLFLFFYCGGGLSGLGGTPGGQWR